MEAWLRLIGISIGSVIFGSAFVTSFSWALLIGAGLILFSIFWKLGYTGEPTAK